MSDLLTEVEDSFREERLQEFWKKYGNMIIAVVLLTIIGTGAYSIYTSWDQKKRIEQTNTLIGLFDSPEFPNNVTNADLALEGDIKAMAQLTAAGRFMQKDLQEDALSLYRNIALDTGVSNEFRDLALLMQSRIQLANGDMDASSIMENVETIANNQDSPWRHHAMVDLANLYASEKKDFRQAYNILDELKASQGLPQSLYSYVDDLQHAYKFQFSANEPDNNDVKTENGS